MKTPNSGHKWLGCILGVGRANRSTTSPPSCLPGFLCTPTNTLRPKGPCEGSFAFFRYCYYSCCYVRLWAPHCLSMRFVPHGCVTVKLGSVQPFGSGWRHVTYHQHEPYGFSYRYPCGKHRPLSFVCMSPGDL